MYVWQREYNLFVEMQKRGRWVRMWKLNYEATTAPLKNIQIIINYFFPKVIACEKKSYFFGVVDEIYRSK